jgi:hypothetical protein
LPASQPMHELTTLIPSVIDGKLYFPAGHELHAQLSVVQPSVSPY